MNYNDIELDYLNKLDIAFENNDKKKIIQLLYELSQMPCDIVGFSYVINILKYFPMRKFSQRRFCHRFLLLTRRFISNLIELSGTQKF